MKHALRILAAAVAILAAAAIFYGRAHRNGGLPEDDLAVWNNPAVTAPALSGLVTGRFYDSERFGLRPAMRPAAVLLHRLEWRLFGQRRAGFIWVRVLLAAACALTLLLALRADGGSWRASAFGGLLLLAHPITARSVLSLPGSSDLLALLFGLLCMLVLQRMRGADQPDSSGRSMVPHAAPGICLLLALLSHEVAFALGMALVLWMLWQRRAGFGMREAMVPAGGMVIALVYRLLVMGSLPQHLKIGPAVESASGLGLSQRILYGLTGVPEILRQVVLPIRLPDQNDFLMFEPWVVPRVALGLLVLAVLAVWTLRLLRRTPQVALWGLWSLFVLLGVCGLVVPTGSLVPARPLLAALPGMIVLAGHGGSRLAGRWSPARRSTVGTGIGLVFLLFFASRTFLLVGEYRSGEALTGRQTREFPRSPGGWFDRGNIALLRGDQQEAIRNYEKATELQPEDWEAWVNMGTAYAALNEPGLAVRAFETALAGTQGKKAFRVVEARANFNRALMLMKQVRNVEAARGFENMLEVFPDHLTAHANLGLIYSNSERLDDKSTMHLNRALQLETDPSRRQLLQDFLDGIQKRRARLGREPDEWGDPSPAAPPSGPSSGPSSGDAPEATPQ